MMDARWSPARSVNTELEVLEDLLLPFFFLFNLHRL